MEFIYRDRYDNEHVVERKGIAVIAITVSLLAAVFIPYTVTVPGNQEGVSVNHRYRSVVHYYWGFDPDSKSCVVTGRVDVLLDGTQEDGPEQFQGRFQKVVIHGRETIEFRLDEE